MKLQPRSPRAPRRRVVGPCGVVVAVALEACAADAPQNRIEAPADPAWWAALAPDGGDDMGEAGAESVRDGGGGSGVVVPGPDLDAGGAGAKGSAKGR